MELRNQIFTGDCLKILKKFPDNSIGACITDPPYNYEFIGRNWDSEEIKRRINRIQNSKTLVKNIPYGSGLAGGVRNKRWYDRNRQNILEYQNWCRQWGEELIRVCNPGALVAVFNSTRTAAHVQVGLESAGFYARDCLVYRRSSGIPKGLNFESKLRKKGLKEAHQWKGWHSCLRNEWEAIVVLQKPLEDNYTNTVLKYGVGLFHAENGKGGFQSNILENIPRDTNQEKYNSHCTPKPLALMEKLVELFVPENSDILLLDPFAGSGTTLLAAKKLGRSFVGIEINSEYVEIIRSRLAANVPSKGISVQSENLQLFPEESF